MVVRKKPEPETVPAAAPSAPGLPTAEGVLRDTQAVVREAISSGDHRTALKGLEMLGKHFGLFADRAEPGNAAAGQVLIYQLPDNGRADKNSPETRPAPSPATENNE